MTTERFKQAYNKLPHVIARKNIDTQIKNVGQEILCLIDMLDSKENKDYFKEKISSIIGKNNI